MKASYAKVNAAKTSKYAAKHETKSFNEALNEISAQNEEEIIEESMETIPQQPKRQFEKRRFKKTEKVNGIPATAIQYPEHIVAIALLIKNNAEIRRFTALGILNYLLQKGEIKGDSRYVSFKWNKFGVKANGLMREFNYNEPFFLNALVAAFSSFSASAQRTIDAFCKKEMSIGISKAVDADAVEQIANLNENYQQNKEVVSVDNSDEAE